MKAEKVIGIAACAFACVTSSAFANSTTNWFGVTASPVAATDVTIKTNNVTVAIADIVAESKITLDGDTELTFAPTDGNPARSDNLVTIESTAVLTPNAFADLPPSSELTGAQVGFAVAYEGDVTNYYCYANGAWGAGAGTPPANAEVTFTITLDYRTHRATFKVGDDVVSNDVAFVTSGDAKLSSVAARGSGSLTEVSAKYEVAVVDVNGTKYGSVADAEAAGGNASTIKVVDSTGTVVDRTEAANGLSAAVCAVLGLDVNDSTAQAKAVPVETDSQSNYVTLQFPVKEANVVEFVVKEGETVKGTYDASAILIPIDTGVYTVTPVLKP